MLTKLLVHVSTICVGWDSWNVTCPRTLRQVVSAFILNRLVYCNSLLYGLPWSTIAPPSGRRERRCAARSGLVPQRPRQFCTPDITLAAHLLPDTVQVRTTHVQCRCPKYINDIVAPVASNPGRKQLPSAARSDVIVPPCRTKFGSRAFSVAGPEVWNSLPQSVRSADTVRQFRRLLKTHYFQLHFGPN